MAVRMENRVPEERKEWIADQGMVCIYDFEENITYDDFTLHLNAQLYDVHLYVEEGKIVSVTVDISTKPQRVIE